MEPREERDFTIEYPVTYMNDSFFVTPRSHLLQKHHAQIRYKNGYKMGSRLYSNRHGMSPVDQPIILSPKNPLKWEGLDLGNVMTTGIYTANQFERVRNQIMYPQERRAISVRFAGTLNHDSVMHQSRLWTIH